MLLFVGFISFSVVLVVMVVFIVELLDFIIFSVIWVVSGCEVVVIVCGVIIFEWVVKGWLVIWLVVGDSVGRVYRRVVVSMLWVRVEGMGVFGGW